MPNIQMVDLKSQYQKIKSEIDDALIRCVESTNYINGPEVKQFQESLANYLNVRHVIPCANGTDALQIALMSLELNQGDEVIVPSFTYVATAEAIALLGFKPVMVDVDAKTFNINPLEIEKAITSKTKAIVPVHLYGQSADMTLIMDIAQKHNLFVIEDNAQSMGAECMTSEGIWHKTGTIGDIGCNSFFPTKNLGCFGDGGAITTNNDNLAEKCRIIASHGQKKKYYHSILGCNSRLDTLHASILMIKLKYLDKYIVSRQKAASFYSRKLKELEWIEIPYQSSFGKHTFNQYTLIIKDNRRNELQQYLHSNGIPTMIYYPLPLYKQEAFLQFFPDNIVLRNTENLCKSVMSIPMHTELTTEMQEEIIRVISNFK